MCEREQIRLELVKVLLQIDAARPTEYQSAQAAKDARPLDGMRERVDALEAIVRNSAGG